MSTAARITVKPSSQASRLCVSLGHILTGAAYVTTLVPPRLKVQSGLAADRDALVSDKAVIALDAYRANQRVLSKIAG